MINCSKNNDDNMLIIRFKLKLPVGLRVRYPWNLEAKFSSGSSLARTVLTLNPNSPSRDVRN